MRVVLQPSPFPHLAVRDVLDPAIADVALKGLSAKVEWKLKEDTFYSHYGVDLVNYREDAAFEALFTQRYVASLKALVETAFSVKLRERYLLWAHKLADGQGIGPHNDNEPAEFRFVVQLGITSPGPGSGYLVLFDEAGEPRWAYPPTHNSAVCFNTNATSHHAVTEVSGDHRYSVIYVFTAEPGPAAHGTHPV
jgi:hypothetical protein